MEKDYLSLRKNLLDDFASRQEFRVSSGKSKWIFYKEFEERFNLREILKDEIVIEFDTSVKTEDLTKEQIEELKVNITEAYFQTRNNLIKANIPFKVFDHGGKSPHIHIQNLPVKQIPDNQIRAFKRLFIKRYVPLNFHCPSPLKPLIPFFDDGLTGIHLIAIEYSFHWKGIYGFKDLIFENLVKPKDLNTTGVSE